MKKYILLAFLLILATHIFSQNIQTDIFGNLSFESERDNYKAYLKKDIFDKLTFSDNKNNNIAFDKKYLQREYNISVNDKESVVIFFKDLIRDYRRESNYKASYEVDIFDKVIFKDNRKNSFEKGKDIFGNNEYNETINGVEVSIKRDLKGNLIYSSKSKNAKLEKNIDSEKNNLYDFA